MKLEVGATPPVGRHRRLANGSSSAGIAPVALTQPTPNSEEPQSSVRANLEDGLLDAMIGLEALLSDSNQEMTHKIALRMAGLYKLITPERASDVFRELKAIYKLRSKIVHGADFDIDETLDRGASRVRVVDAAVEHLRAALRTLIEHREYLDVVRIDRELLLGA